MAGWFLAPCFLEYGHVVENFVNKSGWYMGPLIGCGHRPGDRPDPNGAQSLQLA